MAQYHPPPAAQRARSPPPPPQPHRPSADDGSSASSLLFPSLPASAPVARARGRSQDVRPVGGPGAVEPEADWSLILPAPASRSTSYQRPPPPPLYAAAAGPSICHEHRPRSGAFMRLPYDEDGRGDLRAPASEVAGRSRPALPARTASEQTHGSSSFDERSTDAADDFSSLDSTTDDLDSSASDRDLSPGRSPPDPGYAPFAGSGPLGSNADSSPSPPLEPELVSLSRVPTIVGLSAVRSQGSFAMAASVDTAGFRPTFSGARAGREWRATLVPRRAGPSQGGRPPITVGGTFADGASPAISTLGWGWPFRSPSVAADAPPLSAGPDLLTSTFGFLRSLLAMDEASLLLLFAAPPIVAASESAGWSEKSPVLVESVPVARGRRPRLRRRLSSFDPGSDSRRALLLRAVGRVTGQSQRAVKA